MNGFLCTFKFIGFFVFLQFYPYFFEFFRNIVDSYLLLLYLGLENLTAFLLEYSGRCRFPHPSTLKLHKISFEKGLILSLIDRIR